MSPRVAVYHIPAHRRSLIIANAMLAGILKVGDKAVMVPSNEFSSPDADVAVFYGFDQKLRGIFHAYRAAGLPVVLVDMGYFGRLDPSKWAGFHKVSVNSRHPTAYFQRRRHDNARSSRFRIVQQEWRTGKSILVAGTSDKGALVDGFHPEEWERSAIAALRMHTDRPIIYRAKPSWLGAAPIAGAAFEHTRNDVLLSLRDCHAVVTHHSNVAVDGLINGVPAFCMEGVATPLALSDLAMIESPKTEGDREQWVNDISYCQFDVREMTEGVAWRHLKNEGLLT